MFKTDKSALELNTNRKYLIMRFVTGCRLAFSDWRRFAALLLYIISASYVWINKSRILPPPETIFFNSIINYITDLVIILYIIIGLIFTLVLFGTPRGAKSARDNLWKAGLVNHAGESPLLLSRIRAKTNKKIIILEFMANGIPLKDWQDKKLKIESALNLHIAKISEGKNKTRILLYTVSANYTLPDLINWKNEFLSNRDFELILGESLLGKETVDLATIPHVLLGGSTGSGKSILLKSLIMQCVLRGAIVCIADFKGGVDFPSMWHQYCTILTKENDLLSLLSLIVEELMYRQQLLKESGYSTIKEHNEETGSDLKRYVFFCDEIAEILDKTGLDKYEKEIISKIENKLATIARQGRAFGIHLILATQRPDATILQGQIRNNINYRVCGRADNVLSQIILDNTTASDQIPKDAQGRFINHEGTVFQGYWCDEHTVFDDMPLPKSTNFQSKKQE